MKILELFSGTGSWDKYCVNNNIDCISVDISNKYHTPTHLVNILEWDYTIYPKNYFDIITASPPCRFFSPLQSWNRHKKTLEEILNYIEIYSLPLVRKTFEIIEYFSPTYYFVENPYLGKMKNYVSKPYIVVDYCRFGYDYKKPTIIFTNKVLENCRCKHGKVKHKRQIGDKKGLTTLQERYSIPQDLIKYLLEPN